MRTLLMVAALMAAVVAPAGAQERLADRLRKGIAEEEAGQNVDKAIQVYQSIVASYDEDRKAAGTALFRLAECYRKAGKREQAVAAYQRVVREFADQQATVESSRHQLASLGVTTELREARAGRPAVDVTRASREPKEMPPEPERTRAALPESLEATKIEIDALQWRRHDMQMRLLEINNRYKAGTATTAELDAAQSEIRDIDTQTQRLQLRFKQQQADIELARRTMESVQKEIGLVQERIAFIDQNIKKGLTSEQDTELLTLRRDLLGLQRKLDELRAGMR